MNKSKITAFQPSGQWRDMYKFSVQLEDGTEGTAFSKSEQLHIDILISPCSLQVLVLVQ